MRKILILLLLAVSLIAEADKWYIATAANGGSDTDGDGSSAHPWLTLKHAADTVTGAAFVGDTIVVGAGTFSEPAQITLGVGVSIYGAGATSIITSGVTTPDAPWDEAATIILSSASQGTDGSQSISYLYFDGDNLTADAGILVYQRKNVSIHHCTFNEFHYYGARIIGASVEPTTYATGNSFHDNTIYNSGGANTTYGNLQIGGQEGMLIYNNNIEQPYRTGTNQYGFGIKFNRGGHFKGVKIYDNVIRMPATVTEGEWHFSMELFNIHGGVEIYGNTCVGTIDFSSYVNVAAIDDAGGYGYGVKVYNNILGLDNPTSFETYGVTFERNITGGVYVYNNYIKNVQAGITLSNPDDRLASLTEDVYFYNNVIHSMGTTDATNGSGIQIGRLANNYTAAFKNISILNNTIVRNGCAPPRGIYVMGGDSVSFEDIRIQNNIVKGIVSGDAIGIYLLNAIIDTLSIVNNCLHDNGTDIATATATLTNETIDDNLLTTDPVFVSTSDYHLQSTSPARDAGIDVSAITGGLDFHGAARYGAAYDIGAFEYGVGRMINIGTTIPTISYKIPLIDH